MRLDLPPTWATAALGDLGLWRGGGTPSKSNPEYWSGGTIPWISPKDMRVNHIVDSEDLITSQAVSQSSAKLVSPGAVLVVTRSGILEHTLPVAVTEVEVAINQDLKALTPEDGILPKFVSFALRAFEREILHECRKSGTTVASIEFPKLLAFEIPIAPLSEQRRIVAEIETQFTRLDAAVAALERARANLKRYRAAVLLATVSFGTTHACSEEWQGSNFRFTQSRLPEEGQQLPNLPSGWDWATLGDYVIDIQAGKSFRCEERPPREGETGVVKVSAVTWGEYDECQSKTCLDPSRIDSTLFIRQGDFLFSRANTIDLVGAAVIARKVTRPIMLSDKILRFTCEDIDPRWLLYYLRSSWGRHEIERLATGNQESMRNIGQDRIRRIRIPVAPESETATILEELERRLYVAVALEATLKHNLVRAERTRQSILKRAFSGQLVSQDPSDEPAQLLLRQIQEVRGLATAIRPKTKSPRKETQYALW